MGARRFVKALAAILAAGTWSGLSAVTAQEYEEYPLEARVWLDRGQEPVLQRGEAVRVYYRTSEDAYVAIFHIDTNGTVRLVFPNSPQENHYARGGRDYRVLFPGSSYWYVDDDPGLGYFFIVASPQPFSFTDLRYSHYDGGWDLSYVGRQVYSDPYLAMDDYVAALIPEWEYVPYGLDFTAYNVEQRYDYPRFMCYDCHGFRPYYAWNPYLYACTSFRVVIYNDPYYYPVTRYRGTRVVYVQPRRGVPHFGFKERADGEPWTPQVVVRDTPPVGAPGVDGTANRRTQAKEGGSAAGTTSVVPGGRGVVLPGSGSAGVVGGATRKSGGVTVIYPSRPSQAARGGSGNGQVPPNVSRTDPGRSGVTSPTAPGRPIITPPPSGGAQSRPTGTRSTSGSTAKPGTNPPGSGTGGSRPSGRLKPPGGATTNPPAARSGGSSTTARPTVRSGGSRGADPPKTGSGGSGASTTRPTVRSGGSAGVRPPTVRGGVPSGGARTPPVRSGSSGSAKPPTARSGGSPGSVRRSGSGAKAATPPARTVRTPPKKRSGGGGL